MPLYEIEQYELHAQTFQAEAASEAEAIKKLLEGKAQAVDNGLALIEVCDDYGLPVEEYAHLAEELRALGVAVDECVIPAIRSVGLAD